MQIKIPGTNSENAFSKAMNAKVKFYVLLYMKENIL
jgi:hypothetical protein